VYVVVSSPECRSKSGHVEIANISFEHVSHFKYLGTTVTNQILIQEEIKRIMNFGNVYYHLVHPLSKNVKIRIQKTMILHVGSVWM
jgi:DNA-directed RNA polymerase subunit L